MSSILKEAALAYARQGRRIFTVWGIAPDGKCDCGKPSCSRAGKHPIGRLVPEGFKNATSDVETVGRWWDMFPNANIGLATGKDCWVLDLDGKAGTTAFEMFCEEHGGWPETLMSRTGGGGLHLFFAPDDRVGCRTKISGRPIDVRGQGGYVVLPPSSHQSGNQYRWENELDIQLAPDWLLNFVLGVTTTPREEGFSFIHEDYTFDDDRGASEGTRNQRCVTLTDRYLEQNGADEELAVKALAWAARCKPPYPPDEVRSTVNARVRKWSGQTSGSFGSAPLGLPEKIPPVPKFNLELLPQSTRAWVEDIADRMQCPLDFLVVTLIVALAVLVGRKIAIRPKQNDDWEVVPNLWGAVIGRPGVLKSPAIQEIIKPLQILERQAHQEYESATQDYVAGKMVSELQGKQVQQQIKKALAEGKHDEATEIARSYTDSVLEEPKRKRYVLNDSSVEKLGEILADNPNGVLVYRDELIGFFRSQDKDGQEGSRAFYLEAWNGNGQFTYDRIGRGTIVIEAAVVSVFGGIQPGPLNQYFQSAADTGKRDDGLIQRFQLIVWPDVPREWKNVDRRPDLQARGQSFEIFTRLSELDPIRIHAHLDGEGSTPYLRFTPEAQSLFDQWREKLERRIRSDVDPPAIEAHISKYRSLIPSIALLIHLADGGQGDVGIEPLQKAIGWAEYLESHARRVYSAAVNPGNPAAHALAKHIRAVDLQDGFTVKDVYRPCWSGLTSRQVAENAISVLIGRNWLAEEVIRTKGRQKTVFRIHPDVLEKRKRPRKGTAKTAESSSTTSNAEPVSRVATKESGRTGKNEWEF